MNLILTDLEQAINYWRARRPSQGEESALSAEVNALANVYALMIYQKQNSLPLEQLPGEVIQLIQGWRQHLAQP
jgi:hypothetical protein